MGCGICIQAIFYSHFETKRGRESIFTVRFGMLSNHNYSQCAMRVTKKERKGCDSDMRCSVCNDCGTDKAKGGSFDGNLFNILAGIGLRNDRDGSDLMM